MLGVGIVASSLLMHVHDALPASLLWQQLHVHSFAVGCSEDAKYNSGLYWC
jgi:hypothetical protein